MQKITKYVIVGSMLFSFACIAGTGLWMPWTEEGVMYTLYGGSVGLFIAISLNMFMVWKWRKK